MSDSGSVANETSLPAVGRRPEGMAQRVWVWLFPLGQAGRRSRRKKIQQTGNGVKMSAKEKMKAATEQVFGRAVKETGQATGHKKTAAKGTALGTRGKARHLKEGVKDRFKR
ncbi:hypothetical protein ABZY81_41465 [Streptomyces sp. NPDC006514]|uniref:CsbD family protein n=1 Tax=Streptomyces sp. NPDC006514 TaxID=3154308 RepID=UPI0033B833A5